MPLSDFIALFYPNNCGACGQALVLHEERICTSCKVKMPRTRYHEQRVNPIYSLFAGRVHIEAATALFFFHKGGLVQNAMHQLKYNGNTEIGAEMGKMLGLALADSNFPKPDCIVPVPLHPKKKKTRGYNQCDPIAEGISEVLGIDLNLTSVVRRDFSETQTKKSRFDRWENVASIFEVRHPEKLEGKNVLLVDDVVTTGSTLEACAHTVLSASGTTISIATLACA